MPTPPPIHTGTTFRSNLRALDFSGAEFRHPITIEHQEKEETFVLHTNAQKIKLTYEEFYFFHRFLTHVLNANHSCFLNYHTSP